MLGFIKRLLTTTFIYRRYKEIRAAVACLIHGYPAKKLFVIGVTGTDGKTTTCHLLYHMLRYHGKKTVCVGTTGAQINGAQLEGIEKMTSYDPLDLQSILEQAVNSGCTHAVIETSSHGLDQYRFNGVPFRVGVLTNITAEHLDYHKTIDQYAASKQKLFRRIQKQGKEGVAILPLDDTYGRNRSQRMHFGTTTTYGLTGSANLQATMIQEYADHTSCTITHMGASYGVDAPLLGKFNIKNILAACGAALACGLTMEQIIASLPSYQQAPGRQVHLSMDQIDRYIDYAHTPNGLDVMLQYLHSIKGTGRLICLFGAPGLRDRYKRPDMARVVEALSDIMIITEDDSATENTWQIISDIVAGVQRKEGESLAIIPDRRLAIRYLCAIAQPGDVVLLAGKGHEKVLLTNAGKIPRSDETVLKEERQKK